MARLMDRLKHAWNAFTAQDSYSGMQVATQDLGASYSYRPDRNRLRVYNEKSIISSIYVRIGVDVASVNMRHARVDENDMYLGDINSGLNNCLTIEANIDQAARMFRQDMAMTMCDEGVIAVVPVDTTLDPFVTGGYDVTTLRVGKVISWYPKHVCVRVYNDTLGIKEDITLPKTMVAIIENPLYAVMNEPNSTLQRLLRKLNLLDSVDEQSASGNLDIIIQLPYVVKTETKREEARKRLKEIEFQLKGSQYGIAYTDGTEKITQLNRPATNNLMTQVEYLTELLYSQLGLTKEVMDGTADESAMLNYFNRTVEPFLAAIAEAFTRVFLTKTARSQNQAVVYLRDPFRLVPVKDLAEIADKFTRNEILSSNEVRGIIGRRPSSDPKADKLLNKNLPAADTALPPSGQMTPQPLPRSLYPVAALPQGASQNGT